MGSVCLEQACTDTTVAQIVIPAIKVIRGQGINTTLAILATRLNIQQILMRSVETRLILTQEGI